MSESLTKEKLFEVLGKEHLSPLDLAKKLNHATSEVEWYTSNEFKLLLSTLISRNEVMFDSKWNLCLNNNI